jgi:uncharacterized protein (TIGR02996 family)
MTDEAFLRALAEAPNDDPTRLVYADWLEERDDPRAEFLRASVALAASDGPGRDEAHQRFLKAAVGHSPEWIVAVSLPALGRRFAVVGSWRMEGVSVLLGRPSPDEADDVWKPARAGPRTRGALRNVGFTFLADGEGRHEVLNMPLASFIQPFTWRYQVEGQADYLIIAYQRDGVPTGRLRVWARLDGRMLLSTSPDVTIPQTATLMYRYDPPATFRPRSRRRRQRPGA